MTTLQTAAQQALDRLRLYYYGSGFAEDADCITALEAALAQRKPLAEWQITDLMADIDPEDVCSWSFRQGAYAAEKHHGIRP